MEQLVARQPHKLEIGGSSPPPATNASLAQLVEQLICHQQVIGSTPIRGSDFLNFGPLAQLVRAADSM